MKIPFNIELIGAECQKSWQGKVHSVFKNAINIETNNGKLYTILYNPLWIAETNIIIDKAAAPIIAKSKFFSCDGQFLSHDGKTLAGVANSPVWEMPHITGREVYFSISTLNEALSMAQSNDIINYISKLFSEKAAKFIHGTGVDFEDIIGAGQGLTPSGDDMLTGFALALLSKAPDKLSKLAQACTPLLPNTTDISRHLLKNAFEGKFIAPLVNILLSTEENIASNIEIALNIGSSSGRDGLFGLYTGLKLLESD